MKYILLSKHNCSPCQHAKEYLKRTDIDYRTVELGSEEAEELIDISGAYTVPQLFTEDKNFVAHGSFEILHYLKDIPA